MKKRQLERLARHARTCARRSAAELELAAAPELAMPLARAAQRVRAAGGGMRARCPPRSCCAHGHPASTDATARVARSVDGAIAHLRLVELAARGAVVIDQLGLVTLHGARERGRQGVLPRPKHTVAVLNRRQR